MHRCRTQHEPPPSVIRPRQPAPASPGAGGPAGRGAPLRLRGCADRRAERHRRRRGPLPRACDDVTVGQRARFMFVVEGSGACAAEGPVTRLNPGGEFIVELDKTSPAFRAFVSSLAV